MRKLFVLMVMMMTFIGMKAQMILSDTHAMLRLEQCRRKKRWLPSPWWMHATRW